MINAQMVKELREMTGVGMMDCKKALAETNGNIEEAIKYLREKGVAKAVKKAGRIASEGVIEIYITDDKKTGVMLELNSETDFVGSNEEFLKLAKRLSKEIAMTKPNSVEAFLEQKFEDSGKTVKDEITELIAKIGENINLRRFELIADVDGFVNGYIHAAGKIGSIVEIKTNVTSDVPATIAKNVAMHISATSPLYLNSASIDSKFIESEKEILTAQALAEGKPADVVAKMVEGRIKKYLKEISLLDQQWIRNPDFTIAQYVEDESKKAGMPIEIVKFARYERGEGIEKKVEDFAEEVKRTANTGK